MNLLALAAVGGAGYLAFKAYNTKEALKAIDVSFNGLKLKHVNLAAMKMDFELQVEVINPSTVSVTIEDLFVNVFMYDTKVATIQKLNYNTKIEAHKSTILTLPFTTASLWGIAWKIMTSGVSGFEGDGEIGSFLDKIKSVVNTTKEIVNTTKEVAKVGTEKEKQNVFKKVLSKFPKEVRLQGYVKASGLSKNFDTKIQIKGN